MKALGLTPEDRVQGIDLRLHVGEIPQVTVTSIPLPGPIETADLAAAVRPFHLVPVEEGEASDG